MMKESIKDLFEIIISYFFPNRCIFCDSVIGPFDEMCPDCQKNLPWIDGEICILCGSRKDDCVCKKRHGNFYDGVAAPLYYMDNAKKCIHRFKFRDEPNNSKVLALLMERTRKKHFENITFDYIAYIPMNKKQEKRRGYNQCKLLAVELSKLSGIPVGEDIIIKLYQTDTQHLCKNASERSGNLFGVFDINPKYNVKDKTILIVDDVKTSGATLKECSKMFYLYDAKAVYCLTSTLVKSEVKKKKEGEPCSEQK